MDWYGIKLLFRAEHVDEKEDEILYQETVLLVRADDEDKAKEKAANWSINEEVSYSNVYGKRVKWKFIKMVDVYQLPEMEIGDCTEVYSSFFYEGKGKEYKDTERLKS